MTSLDLILAILCAWRLTQLLIWDDLLSPVTCWLANRHRLLDELFGCAHCMAFWCALVTVVAVTQDLWLIRIGVWAFAVSGAVSLIQHATGWLDTEVPVLPESHEEETIGSMGGKPLGPRPKVTPSKPTNRVALVDIIKQAMAESDTYRSNIEPPVWP